MCVCIYTHNPYKHTKLLLEERKCKIIHFSGCLHKNEKAASLKQLRNKLDI